jgi:type IV secretion system protein VirD4
VYLGNATADNIDTGKPVGYGGDGHLLTIGPTRSGKSRRLLIPNLLYEWDRSALVIDIKGELAQLTAPHRAAKGSNVFALDPFGELKKLGVNIPVLSFNPLVALDPTSDDFVDDTMAVAESLIQVAPDSKDPHWAEAAQDFVCGTTMLARCLAGTAATLAMVRSQITRTAEQIELMAAQVEKDAPHDAIRNKLSRFAKAKDNKEIASVLSAASTQTRFLDSPGIARSLSAGTVDFGAMKREPTTIYLVLPSGRLKTHAKWLRLIISSAMAAMQRPGPAPKKQVLFLLDEFPQLGRLQSVETAVALNAGFGVKVWVAVQHLGQLKEDYGDNWETFLSAGVWTAFAPRDVFTRDHLTKLIGTGTKTVRSTSTDASGRQSYSDNVQKDDLVSPHQWQAMKMGDMWSIIPGNDGQRILRLHAPDFSQLPLVQSGVIKVGRP